MTAEEKENYVEIVIDSRYGKEEKKTKEPKIKNFVFCKKKSRFKMNGFFTSSQRGVGKK